MNRVHKGTPRCNWWAKMLYDNDGVCRDVPVSRQIQDY
jgi:hypothetical protein